MPAPIDGIVAAHPTLAAAEAFNAAAAAAAAAAEATTAPAFLEDALGSWRTCSA